MGIDSFEVRKVSSALPDDEPAWTEEEAKLSAPYSYIRTWERLLEGQHLSGRTKFNWPSGMRAKVVAHMEAEGIDVARDRFLNGIMQNGEPYQPG